jgi:hypothetical protein
MPEAQPFFDAHLRVLDPPCPDPGRSAQLVRQGSRPTGFDADRYRRAATRLLAPAGFVLAGGAVVSGSQQPSGQCRLEAALAALGPDFLGVTQLPAQTPDLELVRLHAAGVRALRADLLGPGGREDLEATVSLALRARVVVGWHLELRVRSVDLADLADDLPDPDGLVIDHLGLTAAGLPTLLDLVTEGARVKAAGFSRGDLDVSAALRAVYRANPSALLAGTDLSADGPGPPADGPGPPADSPGLLRQVFSDQELARVVRDNAAMLYRLAPTGTPSPR